MSNNIYNEGDLYKKRYVFKFIDANPKSPIDKTKVPTQPHKSSPKGHSSRKDTSKRSQSKARCSKKAPKLKDISKRDEDLTCAICIDDIGVSCDKSFKLECGHTFHKECLKGLVKKECPMCRRLIEKLPDDISELIEENMENYRIERQEEIANEDLLSIIADENLMRTMILLYSFVRNMG